MSQLFVLASLFVEAVTACTSVCNVRGMTEGKHARQRLMLLSYTQGSTAWQYLLISHGPRHRQSFIIPTAYSLYVATVINSYTCKPP